MKIVILFSGIFLSLLFAGYSMRKPFPYDIEITSIANGLIITNATVWAQKDCTIKITGNGMGITETLQGSSGQLEITNLQNNQVYNIEVSRKDIKGALLYKKLNLTASPHNYDKRIIVVGASISRTWDLRNLHNRFPQNNVTAGVRVKYEFDKEEVIQRIIGMRTKPHSVFIKECADYFPRDVDKSIEDISRWSSLLKNAGIVPVIMTTIPVTKDHSDNHQGKLQSINNFNHKLLEFCHQNDIKCLDAQELLKDATDLNALDPRYAEKDGLHLNAAAYQILDKSLVDLITSDL